jgi:hypothetical protein
VLFCRHQYSVQLRRHQQQQHQHQQQQSNYRSNRLDGHGLLKKGFVISQRKNRNARRHRNVMLPRIYFF